MRYYYSNIGAIYNEDELRTHRDNKLLYDLEVIGFSDIVNIIYNDIITNYDYKFYRAFVKNGNVIIDFNGGVDEYGRKIRDIRIVMTDIDIVIGANSTIGANSITSGASGDNETFHMAYADYEFDKFNDLIDSLLRPIIDKYAYDSEYYFCYHDEIIDDGDDE